MAGIGKLAAVAAVAVVLGFGYMQLASSEDEALVPREQEAQAAGPTAADLTSVAEAEDQGKREEASQAVGVDTHRMEVSQAPSWSMTKREPYELEVSVVDRFGRPAPGEQVYVAVEGQRFNAAGVTSRDGRLVLRFEAAVASLELQLFVRKWGNSTSGMRTLRMTSGSPRKLAIDLKPVSYEKLFGKKPEHYVGPLDHAPHVNRPAKAGVRFYTWGGVDIGLPIPEMIMTDEEFSDHNETSVLDARATGFSGVLHAANGEPASNALVEALPVGEGSHSWGYTDAQGAWAIDNLAAGEYRLRAGGDDYGIASVKFSLREGEARSWSPTLDRGREVRGRVLSPDEARRSYFVRGTHTNPAVLWSDSTLTDEEGRFAFPNAPAGVMQVEVFSLARTPWGIPVHVESGVTSDGIERDLVLASDALTSGSISIELSDAEGQPVRGAELRLYHGETRRGVFLAPVKNDAGIARYSVAGLPAGIYSLEVHFPSLGWFKRAGLVLDAGQQLELGQQSFAKPGLLIANADPQDMQNASAWQVVLLGDQVDSYTWLGWPLDPWEWAEQEAPGWTKVQLPAGDYALSVGKQAAGKAWFPFSIESGAETSLDLPLAQLCDVKLKFKGGYELGATTLLELSVTEVDSGVLVQRAKLEAGSPSFDLKLLPGRYHVALKDGGRLLEEHTVDVGRPR